MIQFGLRLHDAEKLPVEQVLPLVRQKGFTCAHVALSKSFKELPCTPSALTPGYALYLRHLFEKNGIDIAVLGNYLNLAHPDADALHAIQENTMPISALQACWAAAWWAPRPVRPTRSTNSVRSAAATKPLLLLSGTSSRWCAVPSSTA